MRKEEKVAVAIALVFIAVMFAGGFFMNLLFGNRGLSANDASLYLDDDATTTPSLIVETIEQGTGAEARPGSVITVHYVGSFTDGRVFDSSRSYGEPFTFTLGVGEVITGWDIGLQGMREGGVREITIPPGLAYGASGRGPIPPNAALVFEVELLEVRNAQ